MGTFTVFQRSEEVNQHIDFIYKNDTLYLPLTNKNFVALEDNEGRKMRQHLHDVNNVWHSWEMPEEEDED